MARQTVMHIVKRSHDIAHAPQVDSVGLFVTFTTDVTDIKYLQYTWTY